MSKGGGGGGTQTTKSEPWSGVQDYLTGKGGQTTTSLRPGAKPVGYSDGYGGDPGGYGSGEGGGGFAYRGSPIYSADDYITTTSPGTPGIYGEAAKLYQQGGWTPEMQGITDQWLATLQGRQATNPQYSQNVLNTGNSMLSGEGSQVDLAAARAAQGALDPTTALQQLLSGQVNNPYLDEQIAALGKDLSSNFLENVAPGMRSGAVAAGGFGGSRQGIVEGLGAQGVSDALGTQAANLRGSAFENAQNRMQQVATGLNDQAATVAQNNVNNRLNYANMGSNLLTQGNALQAADDARYQQMLSLLGAGDAFNWSNLGNYASIVSPGAGIGGTSTSSGGGSNPIAGGLGGALAGGAIGNSMGGMGGYGAAIGGGLGLLSAL
ncbi:hypothetical protein [Achromobacter piechaudii]|uniref:Tail fiber domain-containing protein n=1 Tax=Achromobacter piechaudii TaxID=72556 RepID=A0ABM8L2R4_9BURK|nr:hypothetical protein [Achromobacter piechaudii]CAB3728791.1 hypothetical protein LMG1873_04614 [Achromobacter piechaudii]CAB3904998.1 hypothetical protein LMG2828_04701 [Achromobacter piechaudii]